MQASSLQGQTVERIGRRGLLFAFERRRDHHRDIRGARLIAGQAGLTGRWATLGRSLRIAAVRDGATIEQSGACLG